MDNSQKTPIGRTLAAFARRRILDELDRLGKALPCSVVAVNGAFVTVNFEVTGVTIPQVTMPILGSQYIRLPIQVGELGVTYPIDVSIAQIAGLVGGTANRVRRGNLSTLVFAPIGNKNWVASPNANALVCWGPAGVILQDKAGSSPNFSVTVNSSGITFAGGGHTVTLNSSGLTIDGIVFETHTHEAGTYVAGDTPVTGDSGEPVSES